MRKFIAEFIGTFTLILVGCGSMVAANVLIGAMGLTFPVGLTTLTSAVAFGGTLTAMYYTFSKISGGHFNPAVSLAVFIDGGFSKVTDFFLYVIIQLAGGTLGAFTIWMITGQKSILGESGYDGSSSLYTEMIPVIVIELILTFIFVMVFLTVRNKENSESVSGAFMIGTTFTAMYLFGIPFTGGGINPAKSFATSILMLGSAIKQLPVFFIAPLVGAAIGAVVYKFVIKEPSETEEITITDAENEQSED